MVKLKGLGRGLDSLLAGDMDSVSDADSLVMLKVGQLKPGKYQPRSYMDEDALQNLANSIKTQGIIQPILVRQLEGIEGGSYEIIAGERRWWASKIAGLDEVPVLVRSISDEAALAMALIENIQRENLNPLEEAQGIKRLIDEFDMTHEKAAEAVGRSRVAVSNLIRLLTLCEPVQELLMHGKIEMGHARSLIGLAGSNQVIFAERIIKDKLSVREAEKLVKLFNDEKEESAEKAAIAKKEVKEDRDIKGLEETLSEKLGAVVNIKSSANGKGVLKVNYSSLDQLDEIIQKLSGD